MRDEVDRCDAGSSVTDSAMECLLHTLPSCCVRTAWQCRGCDHVRGALLAINRPILLLNSDTTVLAFEQALWFCMVCGNAGLCSLLLWCIGPSSFLLG